MNLKKSDLNLSHKTRSVAFSGLLCALALALSAAEMLIPPIPVLPPGAKLGLSNLVTMFAAENLGLVPALTIALIKGLFAGATRGFTAMLMSLAGGLFSTLIMWLLLRMKRPFGYLGLGVAGAMAHNGAQLLVAALLTTPAVVWYIPWLILFAILTGSLTGFVLRILNPAINKLNLSNE